MFNSLAGVNTKAVPKRRGIGLINQIADLSGVIFKKEKGKGEGRGKKDRLRRSGKKGTAFGGGAEENSHPCIFSGQVVRGGMFFANPFLKRAQLRVPQLLQLSQEVSYGKAAQDRYAEKRGFRLASAARGGAPSFAARRLVS